MKEIKRIKAVYLLMFLAVSLGLLCNFSYIYSKQAAKQLVGPSLQYFPLTKTRITLAPFHHKYPTWMFRFSNQSAFDAEFYVYTTMFGNIEITNPKHLSNMLREIEKLEIYPFSKEGIEKERREISNHITSH